MLPNDVFFLYCISFSCHCKDDLSLTILKIINVTWILERYIGRVGEGLLRTRIISSSLTLDPMAKLSIAPGHAMQIYNYALYSDLKLIKSTVATTMIPKHQQLKNFSGPAQG